MQGLKDKGLIYYDARIDGRAVISKYPIKETERINEWMFKAILDVNGKRVAVYPAHSEYRYYTCSIPGDTMTVALIGINYRLLSLM